MTIDPQGKVFSDEICELLEEMRNDSPEARDYATRMEDALFRVFQKLEKETNDENNTEAGGAAEG